MEKKRKFDRQYWWADKLSEIRKERDKYPEIFSGIAWNQQYIPKKRKYMSNYYAYAYTFADIIEMCRPYYFNISFTEFLKELEWNNKWKRFDYNSYFDSITDHSVAKRRRGK